MVSATPRNNRFFSTSILHIINKINFCSLYQLDRPFSDTSLIESLSITYTENGKRQIQVENLKIENKQIKTAQNNSYG